MNHGSRVSSSGVSYQVGMRHLRAPVSAATGPGGAAMAADIAAAEAFRRGLGWHLLLQVISVVHFAVALYGLRVPKFHLKPRATL